MLHLVIGPFTADLGQLWWLAVRLDVRARYGLLSGGWWSLGIYPGRPWRIRADLIEAV